MKAWLLFQNKYHVTIHSKFVVSVEIITTITLHNLDEINIWQKVVRKKSYLHPVIEMR